MAMIRTGLLRFVKTVSIFALVACTLGCFLISYSYIGGDREDREDMQATASRVANFLSVLPVAHAEESSLSLSSLEAAE